MRLCLVGIAAKHQDVVVIPARGKPRIACPSVSSYGSAKSNIVFDETGERLRTSIWHDTKPQPPCIDVALVLLAVIYSRPNLYSADNDRFVMRSATLAADQALIDLNRMLSADGIPLGANHTSAKLVEYLEGGLVPSERKLALKLNGPIGRALAWS